MKNLLILGAGTAGTMVASYGAAGGEGRFGLLT
jgi:hypothetical protein